MQQHDVIGHLYTYVIELRDMLERARNADWRNIEGSILPSDEDRFSRIVVELQCLFTDALANGSPYLDQIFKAIKKHEKAPGETAWHSVDAICAQVSSLCRRLDRRRSEINRQIPARFIILRNSGVILDRIVRHLPDLVRQLNSRNDKTNKTLINEYELQNILHAQLAVYFDDIRREEYVSSYGGASSRMDFFLPSIETAIETKIMRDSLSTKQLGEQIIVDMARYQQHKGCRSLIFIIYDPDKKIANPHGFETDLVKGARDMSVYLFIVPS